LEQIVYYHIGVETPVTPDTPLPPVPEIPRGNVLVIEGRAPIWRYAMALHRLHGSAAAAIAVYDPKIGAVIVQSHSDLYKDGQIIDITIN